MNEELSSPIRHAPRIDAALLTDLPSTAAAAREIEARGFDGLGTFEGPHDPFLPIAIAAENTTRIELSTGVAIAFARNPMTCAYMASDLQALSRGRFVLGLGTQIRPHIEKRFSQTWSRPNARMREFVRAIRAIWQAWETGERLSFRGEFYTHTLMSPFLSPGPNPHGWPKIALAGFGPSMLRVVGEVAERWIVHPLHTPAYVREVALQALGVGAERAGRDVGSIEISVQTITMIGSNDAEIAAAREKAKGQIAFYGSTPAYRPLLDHHGWGDLQPRLNRLSKEGGWGEMMALITDDMVDALGVSGTPADAGRKLRERNRFAQRTTPVLYNEASPDAVSDLVRAYKGS